MTRIEELLKNRSHIWFWVEEEEREAFCRELSTAGFCFMNGTPLSPSHLRPGGVGVSRNKTVGHVSNLIWYKSFSSPHPPLKIRYSRFARGEEDFLITAPNIQPIPPNELTGGRL